MLILPSILLFFSFKLTNLVAQMIKNLPAMQETWVQSLGQEDPLEKGVATHSSILAWRIPWTEEPGGLPWGLKESDTTEMKECTQFLCGCVGLYCCSWAFSSCGVWASHWDGFFCCGAQALEHVDSAVVVHGLSCSAICGVFQDQGLNSCPLHWQADS